MTKKILSVLLAGLLLLSLAACGTKDIDPKENDTHDIPVDDETHDDEKSEDNSVPFESGILPTHAGAFYEDLTLENYRERKANGEIRDVEVTFLETKEQCTALIHPEYFTLVENGEIDAVIDGQIMTATVNKYTDAFLAEKQVIAITNIEPCIGGDCFVVKEFVPNEDGTFHLQVALQWEAPDITSSGLSFLNAHTLTIEVDRSLGITAENLTVVFWDLRV